MAKGDQHCHQQQSFRDSCCCQHAAANSSPKAAFVTAVRTQKMEVAERVSTASLYSCSNELQQEERGRASSCCTHSPGHTKKDKSPVAGSRKEEQSGRKRSGKDTDGKGCESPLSLPSLSLALPPCCTLPLVCTLATSSKLLGPVGSWHCISKAHV